MSNYLALCQKFREVVGISGIGPTSVTDQTGMNKKITTWIADAEEWILREWADWSFLFVPKVVITVAAGVSTVTLTDLSITDLARWRKTTFVRDPGESTYLPLETDMLFEDYLKSELYLGPEVTGPVERVIIRSTDDALILYPTPTAETIVWAGYYKEATRLAANDSESPIPSRYEAAIINRAKMFYSESIEDPALYASAEKDYMRDLTKLESKHSPAHDGNAMSHNDDIRDVEVM